MKQIPPCPEPRDLRRLAFGDLADSEVAPLEQHLLTCALCVHALNSLDSDDPLIQSLRTGSAAPFLEQPGVSDLIERLIQAPPSCDVTTPAPNSSALTTPPTQSPRISTSPPPRRIGRYDILGQLGAGGMGTVYHANDPQLRRAVAIKTPHFDGLPEARRLAAQRFSSEARAAAAVHPYVQLSTTK